MKNVIVRAKNNSIGLPQDLLVSTGLYGSASSDRYYLYRLLPYIREVDEALYNNWNRYQSSYYTSTIYGDLLSNVSENQCKDVYLDNH